MESAGLPFLRRFWGWPTRTPKGTPAILAGSPNFEAHADAMGFAEHLREQDSRDFHLSSAPQTSEEGFRGKRLGGSTACPQVQAIV